MYTLSSSHQLVLQSRLYLQHYLNCWTYNNACTGGCGLCHVTITVAVCSHYSQVITRFISSSSPMIYWGAANALLHSLTASGHVPSSSSSLGLPQLSPVAMLKLIVSPLQAWCERDHMVSQLVILYFISYTMLGYMIHCNHLYPGLDNNLESMGQDRHGCVQELRGVYMQVHYCCQQYRVKQRLCKLPTAD